MSGEGTIRLAVAGRTYEQRGRAEEAARTRMRIIEAVLDRLHAAPAEPIVIDSIARTAGVARSTVYAIFGSRAGLFDAVGRELAARSGYARLVDAKHQPDARDHLRAGFRAASEMLAANRDVYRALRSMAQLDEQAVGGVVTRMDEERAAGMTRLVGRLAEQGVLRDDLGVEDAEHGPRSVDRPDSRTPDRYRRAGSLRRGLYTRFAITSRS
jgi:AcrR family transcriptional regulator